jgi:hypothetical protein
VNEASGHHIQAQQPAARVLEDVELADVKQLVPAGRGADAGGGGGGDAGVGAGGGGDAGVGAGGGAELLRFVRLALYNTCLSYSP